MDGMEKDDTDMSPEEFRAATARGTRARIATERPGCSHCQSLGEPSPRTINGHTYALDWREHPSGRWEEWRWLCECSTRRRGRWTAQSDSVCYHAWLKHVRKSR